MRSRGLVQSAVLSVALLACAATLHGQSIRGRNSAAMVAAVAQHRAALARSDRAGLWVVEDRTGKLVASGVLPKFPTSINSDNYTDVVPGTAGRKLLEFGFGGTPSTRRQRAVQVAYVLLDERT